MKRITLIITALLLVTIAAHAQRPIKERDLLGEWQLIIDIDKGEIMQEIEEDDDIPILGEWIAESVIGVVSNVLDDLEIYFDFRPNGKLRVEAEIFGEREVEYSEWYINDHGELVIGDTDFFDNDDDVWIMEGDRLISYEHRHRRHRDDDAEVYMIRVD